jgi:hypothetical protein
MEFQDWFSEFTNWQIFEMIVLVLVFLFVLVTAIRLLIKYQRDYK